MSDHPLFSTLHNDPEMAELIEFFLDELDKRVAALTESWKEGDVERLTDMAHQLKGAASGYGYPDITHAARELEDALQSDEAEFANLTEQIEALVQLCRNAAAARSFDNRS